MQEANAGSIYEESRKRLPSSLSSSLKRIIIVLLYPREVDSTLFGFARAGAISASFDQRLISIDKAQEQKGQ
jgi:hypothetical protein